MANYPEALDHMLAAWNEADSTRARRLLGSELSVNVRFVDPSIDVSGIDGFEENVYELKSKLPGAVYFRTSGVDSQQSTLTFPVWPRPHWLAWTEALNDRR